MAIGILPRTSRRILLALLLSGTSVGLTAREAAVGSGAVPEPTVLVFAAASLTDVLEEADRTFSGLSHISITSSYAASSVLAKQIEAGARADVFLPADREWMDYLQTRHLLREGTRVDLVGNSLVLIAPADSPVQLSIAPQFPLLQALNGGRLATADPDAVPAGIYARAALTYLGVWAAVEPHLARAENVRAALAFVARAEAPLGIVYGTDARAEKRVRVVGAFPQDSHPPIVYPVAATQRAQPQAARYLEFLQGEAAHEIFARYGFMPAPR
jgi:molybdate transport system substrate-binding protein